MERCASLLLLSRTSAVSKQPFDGAVGRKEWELLDPTTFMGDVNVAMFCYWTPQYMQKASLVSPFCCESDLKR